MKLSSFLLSTSLLLVSNLAAADVMDDVATLQKGWAQVNYNLEGDAQTKAYDELVDKASSFVKQHPDKAEVLIWRGIIESSYAGAKGGLGALSLAKAAKADFETALKLDDKALAGSAYTSLGTLYNKVPGWPIGFGDDDKAEELLKKALTINPDGIDSNYFYGQYLIDQKKYKEAEAYLTKAKNAAPRPSRPLADKGRHADIEKALKGMQQQLKSQSQNQQHAGFNH